MTHDDAIEARKRRMEANYLISLEDPGRFAPQARQGLATFAANQGIDASKRLRDHELIMLQQQGINDVEKENAHAAGLRGQSAEAAEINAGAARYKADADLEAAIRKAETDMAVAESQYGYFADDGTYVPGSAVRGVEQQARATLENARLERESRIRAAELQGQWHRDVAKTNADANKTVAETKAGATVDAAKAKAAQAEEAKITRVKQDLMKGQFMMFGYTPAKLKNMTSEQLTEVATKIAGLLAEEATPPATTQTATPPATGPKEGDRKTFSNGEAVFKGGKWVPVK